MTTKSAHRVACTSPRHLSHLARAGFFVGWVPKKFLFFPFLLRLSKKGGLCAPFQECHGLMFLCARTTNAVRVFVDVHNHDPTTDRAAKGHSHVCEHVGCSGAHRGNAGETITSICYSPPATTPSECS